MKREVNHWVLFQFQCQLKALEEEKFHGVLNSDGLLIVFWVGHSPESWQRPWFVTHWVSIPWGTGGTLKLKDIDFSIVPSLPLRFHKLSAFESLSIMENYYGQKLQETET